jgi:hypothetical protein
VSPGPKSSPPVRMGDVAGLAMTTDRIDAISRKLEIVLASQADVIRRLVALEEKGGKAKR